MTEAGPSLPREGERGKMIEVIVVCPREAHDALRMPAFWSVVRLECGPSEHAMGRVFDENPDGGEAYYRVLIDPALVRIFPMEESNARTP